MKTWGDLRCRKSWGWDECEGAGDERLKRYPGRLPASNTHNFTGPGSQRVGDLRCMHGLVCRGLRRCVGAIHISVQDDQVRLLETEPREPCRKKVSLFGVVSNNRRNWFNVQVLHAGGAIIQEALAETFFLAVMPADQSQPVHTSPTPSRFAATTVP